MFEILKGLDYTPFFVSLKLNDICVVYHLRAACVFYGEKKFPRQKRDRIDHLASASASAIGARVLPARFSIALFGTGGVF